MLVILAGGHAEGDEAASKVASNAAENETEDPSEHGCATIALGNAVLATVGAGDLDGLFGPLAWNEGRRLGDGGSDHHHRLLHLHWLALHRLLLVLLGLRGVLL